MLSTLRQRLRQFFRAAPPVGERSEDDPYARPPGKEPQEWFDKMEDEPTVEI